jgi:ribosomal protein S18 acetylase RimI-like enzyme
MYVIRRATVDDLEQLHQLDQTYYAERLAMLAPDFQCLEAPMSPQQMLERIRSDRFRVFVAESEAGVIGFIVGRTREMTLLSGEHESEGRVCDLFVSKDHRRRGIAGRLYAKAREWFAQQGCLWEGLTVYANNPAQALYEEWGYQPYSVNMRKRL